jgi:cytochrome c peroxidase
MKTEGFVRHQALTVAALAGVAAMGVFMFQATATTTRGGSNLPPVPTPAGNPITEDKRVLGKVLFFDEQLSSDNTVSCATCHQPFAGGADPRVAVNPGFDALFGTPDDVRASPGVISQTEDADYESDPLFGLGVQVTGRSANHVINAAYHPEVFWDGRAGSTFVDPVSGEVVLTEHAALESQAVGPVVSDVEMAHSARAWSQVTGKLIHARPLALASDVPPDMAAAVLDARTYPELFRRAFGDAEITAARIGMALATYQRTLISDQSPWDDFINGLPDAMTDQEIRGWNVFQSNNCAVCHSPPLFTDHTFRNIGLRPIFEDRGRMEITGDMSDRGKFKTPGLRNTGLKSTYMHNGQFNALPQVVNFYAGNNFVPANLDPLMLGLNLTPQQRQDLVAFLANALTDPRVAAGEFPFDAPDLFFNPGNQPNPRLLPEPGRPDSQGRVPRIIVRDPPLIGSDDFKIGVTDLAPGATATLVVSNSPPIDGVVSPDTVVATLVASSDATPVATAHWPIPFSPALDGRVRFAQWIVDDPNAAEPALSRVARIEYVCGFGDCATGCLADFDRNQRVDFFDLAAYLDAFRTQREAADLSGPLGVFNFFDVAAYIAVFSEGCP